MRNLLLVSTSTTFGTGYLDHCAAAMSEALGDARRVLFVPYALHDRDGYAAKARERFEAMGVTLDSVHEASDPVEAVKRAQAVFVGGGNTFRLLREMRDRGIVDPLRRRAGGGMPYLGTSAGSNVACPTIMTTNDMPIVQLSSFDALGLVPFQINPHYLDPEPGSTHMGETRETRIREYLEDNDVVVVGLREGSMIRVEGDRARLLGSKSARVFRRRCEPDERPPESDLSDLLR